MQDLAPNEPKKVWLVYAGPRVTNSDKYLYLYYQLDELTQNIPSTNPKELRAWKFDEKVFKLGTVGSIYPISLKDEQTISYSQKAVPIGHWNNDDHRTEWRTFETAAKTAKKQKSAMMENMLIKSLQPIRNAYKEMNVEDKRFTIAEVIRIITQL